MPGAQRLHDTEPLDKILRDHVSERRLYAAICAAPAVALETKGLLKGKKATAHPAFADKLTDK
jgi:4-methyl-5(b-hydroxyethyl)-thiazole monophosphate biosynthesis